MAASVELKLETRLAWWWWPYYYGVLTMVQLTGLEPDMDKVYTKLFRAVRLRVAGGNGRWRNQVDLGAE